MIWLALAVFSVAQAETYDECLNRITEAKKRRIDTCWKQAEDSNGTISDNSSATQQAIKCEDDLNKSFVPDGTSVTECQRLNASPPTDDDQGDRTPRQPRTPVPPNTTPTAKPKPTPTVAKTAPKKPTPPPTSGASTRPQPADIAQDNANTDISACATTRNQASQCCNNPLSCASSLSMQDQMSLQQLTQQMSNGPAQGQSIADYCNQMQQASQSSGSVNNGLSAVCYSNQSSCTSTCSSLVQKYQALVDNCGDCDAASVYSSTLASLQSSLGSCQNLQANLNAMARQGIGSANGQAMGSICSQQASFNPQSVNNGGGSLAVPQAAAASDPYGCQQNPQSLACQACAMNPQSPACQSAQQANPTGKAGFQTASKRNSDFNPTDDSLALAQTQAKMNMATASAPSLANQNQAERVPNNSGGAIPGQQGAQQMQANLQPGGAAPAAAQAASTDIMQGYMAGGYSQGNGSGFEFQKRGTYQNSRLAGGRDPAGKKLDLKPYLLPFDLGSRIAGNAMASQINGKSCDLFKKVSERFQLECKLGLLLDCP